VQVNRRVHVVLDPVLREKIKQQIDLISNDVNALQEEQKLMKEKYVNVKKKFKE
jgi:hypothetical protein